MAGWRIASWDRALGRGTVASGVGTLAFDGAVALVDDFGVGEEVDVVLVPAGESYRVTRVAPSDWRDSGDGASPPALYGAELDDINAALRGRDATVIGIDRDGVLRLELAVDSYAPTMSVVFEGCCFVQLPLELPELRQVRAFAVGAFVLERADLAKAWPVLPADATVFRLEPVRFGEVASYVVANRAKLVVG